MNQQLHYTEWSKKINQQLHYTDWSNKMNQQLHYTAWSNIMNQQLKYTDWGNIMHQQFTVIILLLLCPVAIGGVRVPPTFAFVRVVRGD